MKSSFSITTPTRFEFHFHSLGLFCTRPRIPQPPALSLLHVLRVLPCGRVWSVLSNKSGGTWRRQKICIVMLYLQRSIDKEKARRPFLAYKLPLDSHRSFQYCSTWDSN
uniref:Uncharacterized protein n=1 Tax=Schistocephalus solidus TaxID=70667 RepID=A0A0V0JAZ7_SCHSO